MTWPQAFSEPFWIDTHDWHTGGEPFRIVPKLPQGITTEGKSVADRRRNIRATPNHPVDVLRRTLTLEPRGHADMYGCFVVPPDDDGAQFGVLFFHKEGFSTACGHGTIAFACWAVENGHVKAPANGEVDVVIDVPSGRVTGRVSMKDGRAQHVDFINVPSFQIEEKVAVRLPSRPNGEVNVKMTWGGALYATIPASTFGLDIKTENYDEFVRIGKAIEGELHRSWGKWKEYETYGVIFFEDVSDSDTEIVQKTCLAFANGEIDRSPSGSATSARLACLVAEGKMRPGKTFVHYSIVGSRFDTTIVGDAESETEFKACIPNVRGMAHLVGKSSWYIDASDPVFPGFAFR